MMTPTWRRSPFVRIGLYFISGAGCGLGCSLSYSWLPAIAGIILLLFLLEMWLQKHAAFRRRHYHGIFFAVILFLAGFIGSQRVHCQFNPHHYVHAPDASHWLLRIAEVTHQDSTRVSCRAEVISLLVDRSWRNSSGTLLVQIYRPHHFLEADQLIVVKGKQSNLNGPRIPHSFDYAAYMHRKGIHSQIKCNASHVHPIEGADPRTVRGEMSRWRNTLKERIAMYITDIEVRSILYALLLGDDSEVDRELTDAYSASGTIHILAVSGLHVAMIYLVISWITGFLFPKNKLVVWKILLQASLLWAYAGLTGFSPSVLRSAVMCSFFLIASNLDKQSNSMNTLCASAVLLIWMDPRILSEVGFFLSYLAVAGILLLQRPIENLLFFRNKSLRAAWKLSSVSIAAQISTLPLTLFLFHQFPVYFLLANLIVIPISTALLYGGVVFIVSSAWPPAAQFTGNIVQFLAQCMNFIVRWVNDLPGSRITGIGMDLPQFLLFSALLIAWGTWFISKKTKALILSILVVVTWLFYSGYQWQTRASQEETLVCEVQNHLVIARTKGLMTVVYADTTIDLTSSRSALLPYFLALGTHIEFSELPPVADNAWLHIRAHQVDPGITLFLEGINDHFIPPAALEKLTSSTWTGSPGIRRGKKNFLEKKASENGKQWHELSKSALIYRNGKWMDTGSYE